MKYYIVICAILTGSFTVVANCAVFPDCLPKTDSLKQNLTTRDKLKLLLAVRLLNIKPHIGLDSYFSRDRELNDIILSKKQSRKIYLLLDTLQLALLDFLFEKSVPRKELLVLTPHLRDPYTMDKLTISLRPLDSIITKKHPNLSVQRKADIVNALIQWQSQVTVAKDANFIDYEITISKKDYSKRIKQKVSQAIAAITYAWVLSDKDSERWDLAIHFTKEKKRVWSDRTIYKYSGRTRLDDETSFTKAFNAQLQIQ